MSACASILELLVDADGVEAVAAAFVDLYRAFRAELAGPTGRRKEDFNRICGELRKSGPSWNFYIIQVFCATSAVPAPDGIKIDLYGSSDRFASYLLNYATVHMIESVSMIRKATDALKASIKAKLSSRYVELDDGSVRSVVELDSESEAGSHATGEDNVDYGDDFDNDSLSKRSGTATNSAVPARSPQIATEAPTTIPPKVSTNSNDSAPVASSKVAPSIDAKGSITGDSIADDYSEDFGDVADPNSVSTLPRRQGDLASGQAVQTPPDPQAPVVAAAGAKGVVEVRQESSIESIGAGYEDDFESHSAAGHAPAPNSKGSYTGADSTAAAQVSKENAVVAAPPTSSSSAPMRAQEPALIKNELDDGNYSIAFSESIASLASAASEARAPMEQQEAEHDTPVTKEAPVLVQTNAQSRDVVVEDVAPSASIYTAASEEKNDVEVTEAGDGELYASDKSYDESYKSNLSSPHFHAEPPKAQVTISEKPGPIAPLKEREPQTISAHSMPPRPASAGVTGSRAPVTTNPTPVVIQASASQQARPRPSTSPSKTRAYSDDNRKTGSGSAAAARTASPNRRPASSPARGRPRTAGASNARKPLPSPVPQRKPGVPYQRRNMSSVRSTIDVVADASADFKGMLDTSKVRVNNLNDLYELLQYKAFEAHRIVIDSYAIWQKKLEEALKSSSRPELLNPEREYRNRLLKSAMIISQQSSIRHMGGPRSQSAKALATNTLDASRLAAPSDALSKTAMENISRLNELQESNTIIVKEAESAAHNIMRQVFQARAVCYSQPSSVNDRRLEVVSIRAVRVLLSGIQKLTFLCSNLKDSYTNLIKELLGVKNDEEHKVMSRPKTLWSRPADAPQTPGLLSQRPRPVSADPRVLRRHDETAALHVEVQKRPASASPHSPYGARKIQMDEEKLYPPDVLKYDYLHNMSRHRARLNKAIAIAREASPPPPSKKKNFLARHEDYLSNIMLDDDNPERDGSIPRSRSRPKQRKRIKAKPAASLNRPKIPRHVCCQCEEKFGGEPKIIPTTSSIDPAKVEEVREKIFNLKKDELRSGDLTAYEKRLLQSSLRAQRRKEIETRADQKIFCSWACARKWNNANVPPQLRYYSNILIDLMD